MTNTTYTHIDAAWLGDFVVEARVRDYTGAAIGAALAEVESHCAASGESAQDAFGDASAYAASLDLPTAQENLWPVALGALISLVGLNLAPEAVSAALKGATLPITLGQLATFGLVAVAIALLVTAGADTMRFLLKRRSPAFAILFGACFIAVLVGLAMATMPVFTMNAILAVGIAVGALLVGGAITWRSLATDERLTDPVTPNQGSGNGARLLITLLIPAFAVLMTLMRVLLA